MFGTAMVTKIKTLMKFIVLIVEESFKLKISRANIVAEKYQLLPMKAQIPHLIPLIPPVYFEHPNSQKRSKGKKYHKR